MDSTSLYRLRAGKSRLDGKLLVADTRKGVIDVLRDQDGLVHFTWTVREAAPDGRSAVVPELDLVLFPGQATFSRLHGRRMFLLKYEGQEHFFWSQEPDDGQDEAMSKDVHECINSFVPDQSDEEAEGEDEENSEAKAFSSDPEPAAQPQQSQQSSAPVSAPQQGIQAADLARVLGSLQPPQSQGQGGSVNAAALAAALSGIGGGDSAGGAGHMEKAPGPSLAEVLNPETIIPLMRQPGMLEQLSQYLPEEQRTEADLADLAASTQLHHQLRILGAALQTAQIDPAHFGLHAKGYTVVDFLEAIQKKVDDERKEDKV
ncbi:hypothetical protein CVIRNUC_004048 [Coccomyxa viridis]|uniref:Regulatory particle non-ATPase 13 n=1 Tax=Coccomyxa viridis TaxID=1274662 RepID=A0AAV1I0Q6_9CHLO|nr:hypothetical protein CVIRNUC_004048 [Coccomyxa viridis]